MGFYRRGWVNVVKVVRGKEEERVWCYRGWGSVIKDIMIYGVT